MAVPASDAWKLALAVALGVGIIVSVYARAPRRAVRRGELARIVASALVLYAIGLAASITGHPALAGLVYAMGIALCAFAAWLSRGMDSDDGPGGGDRPADEEPPPDPDGVPPFDWDAFEREFRSYAESSRATRVRS